MTLDVAFPLFTTGEAASFSGFDPRELSQAHKRGAFANIGEMTRAGRRLYSLMDVLNLRMIRELMNCAGMQSVQAAAAVENVPLGAPGDEFILLTRKRDDWSVESISAAALAERIKSGIDQTVIVIPYNSIIGKTWAEVEKWAIAQGESFSDDD